MGGRLKFIRRYKHARLYFHMCAQTFHINMNFALLIILHICVGNVARMLRSSGCVSRVVYPLTSAHSHLPFRAHMNAILCYSCVCGFFLFRSFAFCDAKNTQKTKNGRNAYGPTPTPHLPHSHSNYYSHLLAQQRPGTRNIRNCI